jgi:ribonucleotide reductase alpha subunit
MDHVQRSLQYPFPQQHVGVVHSSNLCTEITLNTNESEIAVCNLGLSICQRT